MTDDAEKREAALKQQIADLKSQLSEVRKELASKKALSVEERKTIRKAEYVANIPVVLDAIRQGYSTDSGIARVTGLTVSKVQNAIRSMPEKRQKAIIRLQEWRRHGWYSLWTYYSGRSLRDDYDEMAHENELKGVDERRREARRARILGLGS